MGNRGFYGFSSILGDVIAEGGIISFASGYQIHTFLGSSSFITKTPSHMEILIVGGGGGGGNRGGTWEAGGGGAGGLIYIPSLYVDIGSYFVTIGAGGPSVTNGANTSFREFVAFGGGKGGSTSAGTNGGSGGGGSAQQLAGGLSTQSGTLYGYGNDGARPDANTKGGGGGGAGGAGSGTSIGGIGLTFDISGKPTGYAGGGGAYPLYTAVDGGGIGNGGWAVNGTGGGGGGGYSGAGGYGGSGIVIIRYRM